MAIRDFFIKAGLTKLMVMVALVAGFAITTSFVGADQAIAQSSDVPSDIGAAPDSSSDIWRMLRDGEAGTVSIPDKQAGVLIQSEGDNWRAFRNGPLSVYSVWALLGMIALLAVFFMVRGRVRIHAGPSGETIERFNGLERFGHWLTATSFILLALTGLNLLYGRYVVMPLIGPEGFAVITSAGKWIHNHVAFAFMAGIALIFVLWVKNNIPHPRDIGWFLKGGGLFSDDAHVPSKKFNGGQKIIFWMTVLGGASLSLSGLQLLFPFEFAYFAKTFAFLGAFGIPVPQEVTPMMEQQYATLWHSIMSTVMITVILAHIYIGSVGMEGAFDAMGSGQVDRNWAMEHHDLWVEDVEGSALGGGGLQPAQASLSAEPLSAKQRGPGVMTDPVTGEVVSQVHAPGTAQTPKG